jgi:hypothetical protein
MPDSFNWTCPHCGRATTINDDRLSTDSHRFELGSKYGRQALHTLVISCPNPECRELTISAYIGGYSVNQFGQFHDEDESRDLWQLVPRANIKVFPDYVPDPILADYREACLVCGLSAKAAATLARRCLQGMIRDFWGVSRDRLVDEIEVIEEKVDPSTWKAIDAVRSIGNIGAHMDKDINLIVDVDPEEAELLIGLIETLITDWYVARHEREGRMQRIVQSAASKRAPASSKD